MEKCGENFECEEEWFLGNSAKHCSAPAMARTHTRNPKQAAIPRVIGVQQRIKQVRIPKT